MQFNASYISVLKVMLFLFGLLIYLLHSLRALSMEYVVLNVFIKECAYMKIRNYLLLNLT